MHIKTDSQKCCGCTACMAVCPLHAIQMNNDSEGFLCPQVDTKICVECGACIKVCPAEKIEKSTVKVSDNMQTYAAKWENNVRSKSASGAFFPANAKYVLEEKKGYVCGCVLNRQTLMPEHIVTNNWPDIQRMQDSKYVQSNMKNCYCEIGELLNKGQIVLFTGTSCQVSGLYSFLEAKHISSENLLTIDFFCHGVPSPKIWKDYLRFYEEKRKRTPIGYRFRSKQYGWGSSSHGSSHRIVLFIIQFRWPRMIMYRGQHECGGQFSFQIYVSEDIVIVVHMQLLINRQILQWVISGELKSSILNLMMEKDVLW